MEIEILGMDRSSTSGSTLLRMMKNTSMSVLDILVRESVQNSLDAALPESPKVRVDFGIGKFPPEALAAEFPRIRSELVSRHGTKREFISIRDSGTTGLTGLDNMKNVNSRLQSLIYQIGKDTKSADSGGSYGYGKTVFFRVGIGLVIYYSRIHENGRYRNLLAATLVEDEGSDPMVVKKESRGISYFGIPDPNSEESDPERRTSLPITDENEIERILGIFGISMYTGNETGTDVIIPFIDTEDMLNGIRPTDTDNFPKWMTSLDRCISFLIQRWYAPRLIENYRGKWLHATVNNGDRISSSYMEPTFRLIQDLYVYALNDGYVGSIQNVSMERMEIKIKPYKSRPAGYLAAACVKKSLLKLDDRPNWNINSVVGRANTGDTRTVVTYTRSPGMLIRYETDGKWCPGITVDEDSILLAIFVLNSEAEIRDQEGNTILLEKYVRSCEQASHDHWNDEGELNIITNIQKAVRNRLNNLFKNKQINKEESESGLSRFYTDIFVPPFSMMTGAKKSSSDTVPTGRRSKKPSIRVVSNKLTDSGRSVSTVVTLGRSETSMRFVLQSESGSIEPRSWESDTGKPFPLAISAVSVTGLSGKRGGLIEYNLNLPIDEKVTEFDDYSVAILKTEMHSVPYGLTFSGPEGSSLALEIMVSSSMVSLSFELKYSAEGER